MNTTMERLKPGPKLLLIATAVCLAAAIFVPIWRIELSAPQYPEGLVLQIFSFKLGGQVDIINGLNHYIGMKTLHKDDFVEFTLLPYIIGCFSIGALIIAFWAKRRGLHLFLASFLVFGIVAMIDFYRWNYNYGHDLDPNAAIVVPGMAYQPPLIGYKQLLNFGAFSIPDLGGWLFIVSGLLIVCAVIIENGLLGRYNSRYKTIILGLFLITWMSCVQNVVPAIQLNKDSCDFCKMTIADGRFSAALSTTKGRVYKFDDMSCMQHYITAQHAVPFRSFYIADFTQSNTLIDAEHCFYLKGEQIESPMGGHIAAFANENTAKRYQDRLNGILLTWTQL
jgi:copper chaperone NosL